MLRSLRTTHKFVRQFSTLHFPIIDTPVTFDPGNTLIRPAQRIYDNRQGHQQRDSEREEAALQISDNFRLSGTMASVRNLFYVGEKAWLYTSASGLIVPKFDAMLRANTRMRYRNLKVITLGACQSAQYAQAVSTIVPDTFVVGFIPPLITGIPFMGAQLNSSGTALVSMGSKIVTNYITPGDIVVYYNGVRVPPLTVQRLAKSLADSIYFNPKAKT